MKMWRAILSTLLVTFPLVEGMRYPLASQTLPCALLAFSVPPAQLPLNPSVADPSFQPLAGARAVFGQYACSGYRIEVPKNWNGDLVLYAHGFRGATLNLTVTNLPVRQAAIAQGYAWGASSYRLNGYNPQDGIEDTRLLIDVFKQKVGRPKRILLYGSSMGGQVVASSLEKYGGTTYAGGVAECGTIGGATQLDYIFGLNALADYFAGTNLFAPENRSLLAQQQVIKQKLYPALGSSDFVFSEDNMLMGQVNPAPPISLTAKGKAFRNAAIYLSGGNRPFVKEGFAASFKLSLEGPRALVALVPALGRAATNSATLYQIDPSYGLDNSALNTGIKRVSADNSIRSQFATTGQLKAPLLTIHNTGDGFVPITNQIIYRKMVESAGKGNFLVQRAMRRFVHCDFSLAERNRTFNDLVKWVNTGSKPEGEDFSGSLQNIGKKWTEPLRPDDPGDFTSP